MQFYPLFYKINTQKIVIKKGPFFHIDRLMNVCIERQWGSKRRRRMYLHRCWTLWTRHYCSEASGASNLGADTRRSQEGDGIAISILSYITYIHPLIDDDDNNNTRRNASRIVLYLHWSNPKVQNPSSIKLSLNREYILRKQEIANFQKGNHLLGISVE